MKPIPICCSNSQFVHGVCITCGNCDNAEGPCFYGRAQTKQDREFQKWFRSLGLEQKGEIMDNCVYIPTPYRDVLLYIGDVLPAGQKTLNDFSEVSI